jgi:hypothetical protein
VALREHAPALASLASAESGQAWRECLDLAHAAADCFSGAEGRPMPAGDPHRVDICPRQGLLHWAATVAPRLAHGHAVVALATPAAPLALRQAASFLGTLPEGAHQLLVAEAPAPAEAQVRTVHATYVAADADLEFAAAAVTSMRLYDCGQHPGQSPIVYVHQEVTDGFVAQLHVSMAMLEVGDPTKPGTDLGPVATHERLRALEGTIAALASRHATLVFGGRSYQPWGLKGHFLQPTILVDRGGSVSAYPANLEGPVIVVMAVHDEYALAAMLREAAAPIELAVCAGSLAPTRAALGADFAERASRSSLERLAHPWFAAPGDAQLSACHVTRPQPDSFPYAAQR